MSRPRIKEPRIDKPDVADVVRSCPASPLQLLKLREVAEVLRYTSTQSVRDLIACGALVGTDVGIPHPGRKRITYRVHRDDLDAFIQSRRLEAGSGQ